MNFKEYITIIKNYQSRIADDYSEATSHITDDSISAYTSYGSVTCKNLSVDIPAGVYLTEELVKLAKVAKEDSNIKTYGKDVKVRGTKVRLNQIKHEEPNPLFLSEDSKKLYSVDRELLVKQLTASDKFLDRKNIASALIINHGVILAHDGFQVLKSSLGNGEIVSTTEEVGFQGLVTYLSPSTVESLIAILAVISEDVEVQLGATEKFFQLETDNIIVSFPLKRGGSDGLQEAAMLANSLNSVVLTAKNEDIVPINPSELNESLLNIKEFSRQAIPALVYRPETNTYESSQANVVTDCSLGYSDVFCFQADRLSSVLQAVPSSESVFKLQKSKIRDTMIVSTLFVIDNENKQLAILKATII